MEWIRVDVSLPPMSEITVVRDGDCVHSCLHYRVDNRWFNYSGGSPVGINAFTHWLQLPLPPEA